MAGQEVEEPPRLLERLLERRPGGGDAPLDELPVPGIGVAQADQGVDVEAVRTVGGDPPCRGVWLLEVPELLEVRHDVAQRRRRDVEATGSGQLLASHRVTRGDVLADDRVQDVAGAVGKRLGHWRLEREAYAGAAAVSIRRGTAPSACRCWVCGTHYPLSAPGALSAGARFVGAARRAHESKGCPGARQGPRRGDGGPQVHGFCRA